MTDVKKGFSTQAFSMPEWSDKTKTPSSKTATVCS
jgi:hypothetical protein